MKGILIKDTTKSERIQLVKEWEECEGCESSGMDLLEYFRDDIYLALNSAFTSDFSFLPSI